jgi:hypothetical protein
MSTVTMRQSDLVFIGGTEVENYVELHHQEFPLLSYDTVLISRAIRPATEDAVAAILSNGTILVLQGKLSVKDHAEIAKYFENPLYGTDEDETDDDFEQKLADF